jgi:hypothetical protein
MNVSGTSNIESAPPPKSNPRLDLPINFVIIPIGWVLAGSFGFLLQQNWINLSHGIKLGLGTGLMLACHFLGYWLRSSTRWGPRTGAFLHLIGAFLLGLNLNTLREAGGGSLSNIFVLWLLLLFPLPFFLRLKATHLLLLGLFVAWYGTLAMDSAVPGSIGKIPEHLLLCSSFGWLILAYSQLLRRSRWKELAPSAEKIGLLCVILNLAGLSTNGSSLGRLELSKWQVWLSWIIFVIGLVSVIRLPSISRAFRWAWGLFFLGSYFLYLMVFYADEKTAVYFQNFLGIFAIIFSFALLVIGFELQRRAWINMGMLWVLLFSLILSMRLMQEAMIGFGIQTMVLLFLAIIGWFLNKKRREMLRLLPAKSRE